MKARTLWYFAKEAGTGLSRNGVMSLTSVITVTLSLVLLGCFYILISNCNHFMGIAKGALELRVYLQEDADAVGLQQKMIELEGVKGARYVSRTDGAKWLEKNLGIQDLFTIAENPLPDMINVRLADDARVKPLVAQIGALRGVDEVEYGETFVEAMLIVVRVVWAIGFGLLLVIGLVVLYIIINTIRITVLSRRKEIEIMKLVGATDWFIRLPFLLEGVFIGLTGSFLAVVVISKSYHLLFQYVKHLAPFIPLLPENAVNSGMFWVLPLLGLIFGALGSTMSLKKFMRV